MDSLPSRLPGAGTPPVGPTRRSRTCPSLPRPRRLWHRTRTGRRTWLGPGLDSGVGSGGGARRRTWLGSGSRFRRRVWVRRRARLGRRRWLGRRVWVGRRTWGPGETREWRDARCPVLAVSGSTYIFCFLVIRVRYSTKVPSFAFTHQLEKTWDFTKKITGFTKGVQDLIENVETEHRRTRHTRNFLFFSLGV